MIGERFPSVYLEFPLAGDPFLDVTVLYGAKVDPTAYAEVQEVTDCAALFDWFSGICVDCPEVGFGFELDTGKGELPAPAVHFQPRRHTELVEPFFQLIGEQRYAALYLDLAKRMPSTWPLSFFGMFRGRPGSPLRVCGYLSKSETMSCALDARRLRKVFDSVGFKVYDAQMLSDVSKAMRLAPGTVDFQFDLYPDGTMGNIFSLDMQFGVEQPGAVAKTFGDGPAARFFEQLEAWGAADERWRLVADAAFARSIPVELDDGTLGLQSFTLMPGWAKVRWRDGVLQPSKFYYLAMSGLLEDDR